MSINLVDSLKSLFTSDLISNMTSSLGESETGIKKAISGAIPVSLISVLNKAGNAGSNGASGILDLVKQAGNSSILSNLTGLISGGNGSVISGLSSNLFGDKLGGIIKTISAFAGIKESSASSVINMAAPAALATLGNHVGASNMSAHGLMSFLSTQKNSILASVPSDLNLSGAFGLGNLENISDKISGALSVAQADSKKVVSNVANYAEDTFKRTKGKSTNLTWLLLLLVGGLAIWAFTLNRKGCSSTASADEKTIANTTDSNVSVEVAPAKGTLDSLGNFIYNQGKPITIDLPNNGGQLQVGEFSTEAKLHFFLSDASAAIDTINGNWFELTNVRFKTGSSEVTDESMAQLKNIVAISKAYPAAQFKLGGYTDNTGDSTKNVTLSKKRADAVVALLTKLGTPAASITGAEGYGPQWPIGDNTTAEGRAMNRRVALKVKAK